MGYAMKSGKANNLHRIWDMEVLFVLMVRKIVRVLRRKYHLPENLQDYEMAICDKVACS
jgi:hypothetical protein